MSAILSDVSVNRPCSIRHTIADYRYDSAWFVAADFSFAILPWFVVWDLNMKRKEKITVAVGLSLGIL